EVSAARQVCTATSSFPTLARSRSGTTRTGSNQLVTSGSSFNMASLTSMADSSKQELKSMPVGARAEGSRSRSRKADGVIKAPSHERSPNPRLQRTRSALLRSPLSRKPLGDSRLTWWWLVVAATLVVLSASISCDRPPLRVGGSAGSVTIDVQTLGEYLTSVDRVKLTQGVTTLWEIKSVSGTPHIWKIVLHVGKNQSAPPEAEYGSYRVLTPVAGNFFELNAGTRYTVEVWAPSGWSSRRTFILEAPRG